MRQQAQTKVSAGAPSREPMAWLACLTNAVPLAVVLVALLRWLTVPVAGWTAMAIYIGVFTSLVWVLKPWSIQEAQT